MTHPEAPDLAWEHRMTELWAQMEDHAEPEFVALVEDLTAELPAGSAVRLFERGSAQDSTGHPEAAADLYRAALGAGLTGLRRRRATIQLASSLRNLGRADEAVSLLTAELRAPGDELDGAVRGFLALALTGVGQERRAVAVSLGALAAYLPRYNRSLARYAESIVAGETVAREIAAGEKVERGAGADALCAPAADPPQP